MVSIKVGVASLALAVASSLFAGSAWAQEATGGATVPSPLPAPSPSAQPAPPPAPPPPAPSVTPAAAPETGVPASDHERYTGHIAIGYFGVSQLPIATAGGAGVAPTQGTVTAPVIGARYWFSRRLGLDAGVGFGLSNGSQSVTQNNATTSNDTPSSFGFAFHAGVPIALVSASHYNFEIIPETLIGGTTGTIKGGMGVPDQSLSGFRFDIGARAGAEIHFGFIGIPQLALEGSIGLYYRRQSWSWSQASDSSSIGSNTFTTSVQSDPWAIFVNNISARYYF